MVQHARSESPNECVGLLAGTADGAVVARYPLVNALADPRRFESEPQSLLNAEKQRRADGLEFLAIYHSHPTSPPVPSGVDLDPEVNSWLGSGVACVIVSLATEPPTVRAWWLAPGKCEPAEMVVG
jgi:proteasome lid subunit RPN8/RPN11